MREDALLLSRRYVIIVVKEYEYEYGIILGMRARIYTSRKNEYDEYEYIPAVYYITGTGTTVHRTSS